MDSTVRLQLVHLQEELSRFKKEHTNAKLSKAKNSATPFPITVRFAVDTPIAYRHYDVEGICIEAVITEANGGFSTRIRVTDADLPAILRRSIASSLQSFVDGVHEESSGEADSPVGLARLAKHVEVNFGALISAQPDLLETYLVDDPVTGRSVRRFAILKEDVQVDIDVSVEAKLASPRPKRGEPKEQLREEATLLAKLYGQEKVTCSTKGATKMNETEGDRLICDFLHEQGFGKSIQNLSSASVVLTATTVPSSPDWIDAVPTSSGGIFPPIPISVRVFATNGYPKKSSVLCRVQLVDEDGAIAPEFDRMLVVFEKILLLKSVVSKTSSTINAKDIVKDCLNYADQAMRDAMEMYKEAKAATARKPEDPPLSGNEESAISSQRNGYAVSSSGPEANAKYIVHLHNLQMDRIDAMSLHTISLEVLCFRCHKTRIMYRDSLETRWTVINDECAYCHCGLSVSIQPRIIHASCNTLGIVASSSCKPLDFLPSCSFQVQCDCTATRVMHKQFHQGRWNQEACRVCHVNNAFCFERCVFQEIVPGKNNVAVGGDLRRASSSKKPILQLYEADTPLSSGQQLPQTGTCAHYRHSHRWLRFPCCGRRFPCDLCHEQHTDGHEMKWAKSMICGFCSLEQRVDSKCSGCGKRLATKASNPNGRRTCFWEGGEGQRDKKRLSRKDIHKYRNSKAKTVSKKAFAAAKKKSN